LLLLTHKRVVIEFCLLGRSVIGLFSRRSLTCGYENSAFQAIICRDAHCAPENHPARDLATPRKSGNSRGGNSLLCETFVYLAVKRNKRIFL